MLEGDSDDRMPLRMLVATLKLKARTVDGSVPVRGLGSMHVVVPTSREMSSLPWGTPAAGTAPDISHRCNGQERWAIRGPDDALVNNRHNLHGTRKDVSKLDRKRNKVRGRSRVVGNEVLEAEARVPAHKCNVPLLVENIFQLVTRRRLKPNARAL